MYRSISGLGRYLIIVIILILISSSIKISSDRATGIGFDERTRDPWMDIGIDSIEVLHQFIGNKTYPATNLNIRVYFGHDDDPFESTFPVSMQHQMVLNLSVNNGHGTTTKMSKPVVSIPLDKYIGNNSMKYNPTFIDFTWQAPENPPYGSGWNDTFYNISAELIVNDDDKTDNLMEGELFQVSPSMSNPHLLWEDTMQRLDDRIWKVSRGELFSLPFLIVNSCPNIDMLKLSVLEVPEDWTINADTGVITFSPYENKSMNLGIQTSSDPSLMLSLVNQYYIIKLSINSTLIESGYVYPSYTIYTLRFTVEKELNCRIEPMNQQVTATPGKKSIISFILNNTGNCDDSYRITTEIDEELIANGWNATVRHSIMSNTIPFQELIIIISVSIPADAPKFTRATITVTARSYTSGENFTSDPCIVIAGILYGADLQTLEGEIVAYPDSWTSFTVNYTNTGNDKVNDVSLNVTSKPENWTVIIEDSQLLLDGGLHANETCSVTVMVYIDRFCAPSSISSDDFIKIGAINGPFDYILDEEKYNFYVPVVKNFSVHCSISNITISQGESINLTLEVRNEGNWLDTPTIELPFKWMSIDQMEKELCPNGTWVIYVNGLVPMNINADGDPSTPNINENGYFDPYNIKIGVRSQNEIILNSSYNFVNLSLFITPNFLIDMEIHWSQHLVLPISYDQMRKIPVTLINKGNSFTDVRLEIMGQESMSEWISWEQTMIEVPFNSSVNTYLLIDYTGGTNRELGSHSVELTAFLNIDSHIDNNITLSLQIFDIEFVKVLFTLSGTTIRYEIPDTNGSYLLSNGLNYTIDVDIELLGSNIIASPMIDYFDLVLYLDERLVQSITVNSSMVKSGIFRISFENVSIDFIGSKVFSVHMENLEDINDETISDDSVIVMVEDVNSPDEKENNDVARVWVMIFIILIFLIIVGLLVFVVVKRNQRKNDRYEE